MQINQHGRHPNKSLFKILDHIRPSSTKYDKHRYSDGNTTLISLSLKRIKILLNVSLYLQMIIYLFLILVNLLIVTGLFFKINLVIFTVIKSVQKKSELRFLNSAHNNEYKSLIIAVLSY